MFEKFENFAVDYNLKSFFLGKFYFGKNEEKRENSPENVLITIEQLPHA